jgi:hypothetical protein
MLVVPDVKDVKATDNRPAGASWLVLQNSQTKPAVILDGPF